MKKKQNHFFRATLAVLVSAIAIPAATTALMRSQHEQLRFIEQLESQHSRAQLDRIAANVRRRQYWDAMDIYRDLVRSGVDTLDPPKRNDMDSIVQYLDGSYTQNLETSHGSAPVDMESVLAVYNALPDAEKDFLNGYIDRMNYCPTTLKRHSLEGAFELCNDMIEVRKKQQRDSYKQHRKSARTLKSQSSALDEFVENNAGIDRSLIEWVRSRDTSLENK